MKNSISRRPAFIPRPFLHLYNSTVALFWTVHTHRTHIQQLMECHPNVFMTLDVCRAGKKKKKKIRISPYSDDLEFFPNTLNLIPAHKYYWKTDLVQGEGGSCLPGIGSLLPETTADHYWNLGWLLS